MSPFSLKTVALFCFVMGINSSPMTSPPSLPPNEVASLDKHTGTLTPYVQNDYENWGIDHSIYPGVPMITKTISVDNKSLEVHDFDLPKLSISQLREHVFNTEEYVHPNGSSLLSDEEVEFLREVFVSGSLGIDHRGHGKKPLHLAKRHAAYNDDCQLQNGCNFKCVQSYTRVTFQSVNPNVYGFYHYEADPQCGPGSIAETISRSFQADLSLSFSAAMAKFGHGIVKGITQFLGMFFPSIGKPPVSISTSLTYAGICPPYAKCKLWYRPHFKVWKGIATASVVDYFDKRHCIADEQRPFEAHTPIPNGQGDGPAIHGICQSRTSWPCPFRTKKANDLVWCP